MARWYPNLAGKAAPEVDEAIRRTLDLVYAFGARIGNLSSGVSKQISAQGKVLADSLSGSMLDQVALLTDPQNLRGLGSIPPTFSGSFTYTSTPTSITWTWTSLIVYRADGTTTYIPNGSVTITGLVASTTYFFYPYWDEVTGTLQWVTGGVGTPTYAQTAKSNTAAQLQSLSTRVALSSGAMSAATPASGSGGGGGGGSGLCLRGHMLVETSERGHIQAVRVEIGEELAGPKGWTQVLGKTIGESDLFIRFGYQDGSQIEITPTHQFTMPDGTSAIASDIGLSRIMVGRHGLLVLRRIEVVEQRDTKVSLRCAPYHEFYAGEPSPNVSTHNANPS